MGNYLDDYWNMKTTNRYGHKKEHEHTIQDHCINCGAPLEHSYNHKCSYCGSLFDFNEPKEDVVECRSYDLVDVKFVDAEKDFISNSILLLFEGYKLEAPKIYEYDGDSGICVSKAVDIRKQPKAHFIISLREYELENYGGEYLISMLHHYIRPTEIDNIKKQYNEMFARIFKLCRGKIGRYVEL